MNTCLLIPIIVGVLSAILGYLLGRLFFKNHYKSQCEDLNQVIARLQAELKACQDKNPQFISSRPAGLFTYPFNQNRAASVFGKKIKENDLTIIEGIGPKIQQLFHNNNIKTWKSLSNCSVQKCQSILDDGGEAYRIHNPGTWPKQARLAYEGKWKKLLKWQEELDGGQ